MRRGRTTPAAAPLVGQPNQNSWSAADTPGSRMAWMIAGGRPVRRATSFVIRKGSPAQRSSARRSRRGQIACARRVINTSRDRTMAVGDIVHPSSHLPPWERREPEATPGDECRTEGLGSCATMLRAATSMHNGLPTESAAVRPGTGNVAAHKHPIPGRAGRGGAGAGIRGSARLPRRRSPPPEVARCQAIARSVSTPSSIPLSYWAWNRASRCRAFVTVLRSTPAALHEARTLQEFLRPSRKVGFQPRA